MSLETILITLALILPPIVLWRCRTFCEKHPSTVPIRTVPLGCLTMFGMMLLYCSAIPWLYYSVLEKNPPHWLDNIETLLILLLTLPLGIGVIVFLSRHLTKGKKTPCGCLYPIVFVITLMVAGVISCCCTVGYAFKEESRSWYTIILPQLQDCRLAFEQRPSHPFLAEYDYRMCLRYGKEQAIFQLWPNTGRRTFVNVYQLAEDKLLLKDKDTSYLVDTTQKQVYLIDLKDDSSKYLGTSISFAVPLSSKRISSLGRSIPFSQSESLKKTDSPEQYLYVTFADNTTARAVPYEADLQNRKYIGCIMDYSFYTPDEQPEGAEHPRYRQKK